MEASRAPPLSTAPLMSSPPRCVSCDPSQVENGSSEEEAGPIVAPWIFATNGAREHRARSGDRIQSLSKLKRPCSVLGSLVTTLFVLVSHCSLSLKCARRVWHFASMSLAYDTIVLVNRKGFLGVVSVHHWRRILAAFRIRQVQQSIPWRSKTEVSGGRSCARKGINSQCVCFAHLIPDFALWYFVFTNRRPRRHWHS